MIVKDSTIYYRFLVLNCIDISAILACIVSLGGGIYLAFIECSPSWLTRAGSLIIIIGLIAAALRFHGYFEKFVKRFEPSQVDCNELTKNILTEGGYFQNIINDLKKNKGVTLSISEEELLELTLYEKTRPTVEDESKKTINKIIEKYINRLTHYEIYLVIFGTFINGFGDYVFSIFKTCYPNIFPVLLLAMNL